MVIYQAVSHCYSFVSVFLLPKNFVSSHFTWLTFHQSLRYSSDFICFKRLFLTIPQTELCSTFLSLHTSLQERVTIHKYVSPARLYILSKSKTVSHYLFILVPSQQLAHSCREFDGLGFEQGKNVTRRSDMGDMTRALLGGTKIGLHQSGGTSQHKTFQRLPFGRGGEGKRSPGGGVGEEGAFRC